jgi:hypothetical protein
MKVIDADWYDTLKELQAAEEQSAAKGVDLKSEPQSTVAPPFLPDVDTESPEIDYAGMFDFANDWLQFWCELAHTPSRVLRRDLLLFNPELGISDKIDRKQLVILYLKHHPLAGEARRLGWETVNAKYTRRCAK